MPLTPQDVHNKVFGPTRFRRGYDEAEVDAFLDEVEAELLRLHAELDSLRTQVSPGSNGAVGSLSADVVPGGATDVDEAVVDAEFDVQQSDGGDVRTGAAWPGAEVQPFAGTESTAGQAQAAAASVRSADDTGDLEQRVARTLVLAQRAADEAVRDAETQAEQLRAEAEGEAERIRLEAAQEAERARHELERTRSEAEGDVEQLRAFEREYRTRLRAYLELQLRQLDTASASVDGGQATAISHGGNPADGGSDSDAGYAGPAGPAGAASSGSAGTAGPAGPAGAAGSSGGAGTTGPAGGAGAGGAAVSGTAVGGQPGTSGLPTSDLPSNDPAAVPQVAQPGYGDVPPSVPVTEGSDYGQAGGITRDLPGDELRHESRDLHDDL